MLDAKQLGRKVNQGFYNYETGSKTGEQPAKFVERLAQYPKFGSLPISYDKKLLEDYLTQQILP